MADSKDNALGSDFGHRQTRETHLDGGVTALITAHSSLKM